MEKEIISEFENQLRGELIEPTDANYEKERKVYNAMINRKPRLIAKCADVADVMTAIHFGRKHDLRVSIRGGGHKAAGLGGSAADAQWACSTMPCPPSGSPCRRGSSRRPASGDSRWAAAWDT